MDPAIFWKKLMVDVTERKATDIHFTGGSVFIRVNMAITPYGELRSEYEKMLTFLAQDAHLTALQKCGESDFAGSHEGYRLRCNLYKGIKGLCGSFRPLPSKSFPWDKQRLSPEVMRVTTASSQGLVLITGPTGSGKSTTLCSILDYINSKYAYKIITLEDPIEYIFQDKKCIIDQREIGPHTDGFHQGLRVALRQNPNVIFVGEIRDYTTALTALHAAETGHLVFSTLHTKRVANTVSRIIEMAPPGGQSEIRSVIANNIICVMCQRLLPKRDGTGILPCREVMVMNPAAANYIKEGKEKSLPSVMNANRDKGMIDWDSAINKLYEEGEISQETYETNQDKGDRI
jgi:twitching motility protein PilT